MAPFELVRGDITEQEVDAIINAARQTLLGGGGVDGAIHRAAGSGLLQECIKIKEVRPGVRCPTGEARMTKGHGLPARHVIHTVGPVWGDGSHGEDDLLTSCYRSCLDLVKEHKLKSVAFPSISTGAYRFPAERAARIASRELSDFKTLNPGVRLVVVAFEVPVHRAYQAILEGPDGSG